MAYKAGDHRIYMNVGYGLLEEPIRDYFSQFGKVLDVYLPRNKRTNNVMGFGFTTFDRKEDVDRVLEHEEHTIAGQTVKINRAGPRPNYEDQESAAFSGPHGTGPRLYVGGVPQQLVEEDILDHFSQWGQVSDVYFPPQKNGRRSSYCFVRFSSYAEARRAYTESQRRIKGVDIEAINMAKDRLTNKSPDTTEIPQMMGPMAGVMTTAAPLSVDLTAMRTGAVAHMPMVNMSMNQGSFVPMANVTLNPAMTGMPNTFAMGNALLKGAAAAGLGGAGAGPMVKMESAYANSLNNFQGVSIRNGGMVGDLTSTRSLSNSGVLAGSNSLLGGLTGGISSSPNGALGMVGVNGAGMMGAMNQLSQLNTLAPLTGAGGSGNQLSGVNVAGQQAMLTSGIGQVGRISGYGVSGNLAGTNGLGGLGNVTGLGGRNTGVGKAWSNVPVRSVRSDRGIRGDLASSPQLYGGGYGPQRVHNSNGGHRSFTPY
ncbi:hypothetical protein BSKO_01247 [Bryopsis sp. KO-2023]|nr:hypothetical protein BSKO_01247 [Bryopsis sp. KO-2023]